MHLQAQDPKQTLAHTQTHKHTRKCRNVIEPLHSDTESPQTEWQIKAQVIWPKGTNVWEQVEQKVPIPAITLCRSPK